MSSDPVITSSLDEDLLNEALIIYEETFFLESGTYIEPTKMLSEYLKANGVKVLHIYSDACLINNVPKDIKTGKYVWPPEAMAKALHGKTFIILWAREDNTSKQLTVRFAQL